MIEAGIPDHLAEITKEIEAEIRRRIGDSPRDDRSARRAGLIGQYVMAAAVMLADEIGPVAASALVQRCSDYLLEREALRLKAIRIKIGVAHG